MHTIRSISCAMAVGAMLAGCASRDRAADTTSSDGMIAATPAVESPATAATSGSVSTASRAVVGRYLTDASGRALYAFERDTKGASACTAADGCAIAWPPFSVGTPTSTDTSVQERMLGTIKRADARTQATYDEMPLYYYEDDKKPGDIEGQGKFEFGGLWFLVSPSGEEIRAGGKRHD